MIRFRKEKKLLLLEYEPRFGSKWIFDTFDEDLSINIKGTFTFFKDKLYSDYLTVKDETEYDEPIVFVLGLLKDNYFKIENKTLSTKRHVFIHQDIKLSPKLFSAEENVSILKKIDTLVKEDIYIGGDRSDALPESEYNRVIKELPNKYELQKYVDARISSVLRNYFDTAIDGERLYNNYMNKKISYIGDDLLDMFWDNEHFKFEKILHKLETMLKNEDKYNENQWQNEILQIILLLYPKYISVFKEVIINKDTNNNKKKRLDCLLVDSRGSIDIIEIKRPFGNSIVSQTQYRDNFIPLRELSGTIMQIEKYILILNRWGKRGEDYLTKKYYDKLPNGFQIHITNPNGIIIMGRENKLSNVQGQDFEVIKRKYKNIIDIITYDDLLKRLRFTIGHIKQSFRVPKK